MTFPVSVVRSSYFVYWLLFVGLAILGGRSPGPFRDPATIPYPFAGVAVVSLLVGVLLALLYIIFQPTNPNRSTRRVLATFAYVSVLAVPALVPLYDAPGHFYVPQAFALFTFLLMLIWLLAVAGGKAWHKLRA